MESERYFRVLGGADIRYAYTHKIGGVYLAQTITEGSIWLIDEYNMLSIPYYRYEVEEVFDYGE